MACRNSVNSQRGAAALISLIASGFGGVLILLVMLTGGTATQGTGQDNAKQVASSADPWDAARGNGASRNPTDSPLLTGSIPTGVSGEFDVGTRRLVCAFLPGISPMPNMLDERAARRWLLVKQEFDKNSIGVKVNYAFRTLCQQINVKAGKNSYANPCSGSISPTWWDGLLTSMAWAVAAMRHALFLSLRSTDGNG